jgi:hypothetical protein
MAARFQQTLMSSDLATKQGISSKLTILIGFGWVVLAASLLGYQYLRPPQVTIEWETETELETAGFQIYRSTSPAGEFSLITNDLISSKGSPVSGASYTFVDKEVVAGETYFYILEEVELDLSSNKYTDNMLFYQVPGIPLWLITVSVLAFLIGIAFIITGVKEGR